MSEPQREGVADRVFEQVRAKILSGELAPGDQLPAERELAELHGTNRNTLREALRRLQQAGLIEATKGSGQVVTDYRRTGTIELLGPFMAHGPSVQEKLRIILDLLPARARFFEMIIEMATVRSDATDVGRLQAVTDRLQEAIREQNPQGVAREYDQWVETLVDAAHSTTLRWIANPMMEGNRSLISLAPEMWMQEPNLPAFLDALMCAIGARDGDGAVTLTREYFEKCDQVVVPLLQGMASGAAAH